MPASWRPGSKNPPRIPPARHPSTAANPHENRGQCQSRQWHHEVDHAFGQSPAEAYDAYLTSGRKSGNLTEESPATGPDPRLPEVVASNNSLAIVISTMRDSCGARVHFPRTQSLSWLCQAGKRRPALPIIDRRHDRLGVITNWRSMSYDWLASTPASEIPRGARGARPASG